jgi:hypothetical protein
LLVERLLLVRKVARSDSRNGTWIPLERDHNSSWMLRVLGKLMGPNDLR